MFSRKRIFFIALFLIFFSTSAFAVLNPNAFCAFHSSVSFGTSSCSFLYEPVGSLRLRQAVLKIIAFLWPVVIFFTLAFIIIRLYKKLANKAS
jgi:hypothetical protein